MDQELNNVCILHDYRQKALDDAVWKNFLLRQRGCSPFHVVGKTGEMCAVVSDDILEFFDQTIDHPLPEDYADITYDHISLIAQDGDPLNHWSEIKGMFSSTDGEILRFIIAMEVPLEKFIRHELASRGYDKDHNWCGFDKAKEIWLTE